MLHKISKMCDKVDFIKKMADELREMKYGAKKFPKAQIDEQIQQIQAECRLIANDTLDYDTKETKVKASEWW